MAEAPDTGKQVVWWTYLTGLCPAIKPNAKEEEVRDSVGFPERTALFCVKDDWKGQFRAAHYCLSKLRSLVGFPLQV